MNLVTLDSITKQYSDRVLLDAVSLTVNTGDRIGLIGINGSGKTTLLRMIAGTETPDEGNLTVWGGVRIRFLSQDPEMDESLTVLETLFQSDSPQMRLLRDYEEVTWRMEQSPEDAALHERFGRLSAEMERQNGWAAEAQAKSILSRLGIDMFGEKIGTLSGGERKRVALARALLDPADLLILDEPTNHIDAATVAWLEEYLLRVPNALLLVTHDRYFLDRVANKIVELDRRELFTYPGNYTRYLELKASKQERLKKAEEKRQGQLRRELEWLRKGVMARGTKQKARKQRVEEMLTLQHDSGEQRVAMALGSRRLGKKVLQVEGVRKSFGGQDLFTGMELELNRGDRIGIVGPNGAGKSTFLNILAEKIKPDAGTIDWGPTVHLGYYDQQAEALEDGTRVIDFIDSVAPLVKTKDGDRIDAHQMLEWFLFNRKDQRSLIGSLSGGERRRLYLLWALAQQPNVLFLDEPTNDLDIPTLNVLEEFLDHFAGSLIVVSHDRYFLDRTVDYIMPMDGSTFGARYPGPFETYLRLREASKGAADKQGTEKLGAGKQQSRQPKLSYMEKREFAGLEGKIEELENQKSKIDAEMTAHATDYEKLQALMNELKQNETALNAALARWVELGEKDAK